MWPNVISLIPTEAILSQIGTSNMKGFREGSIVESGIAFNLILSALIPPTTRIISIWLEGHHQPSEPFEIKTPWLMWTMWHHRPYHTTYYESTDYTNKIDDSGNWLSENLCKCDKCRTRGNFYETKFSLFEMKIQEDGIIHRKPYRIGNVAMGGSTCFGTGVPSPRSLRQAHNQFWNRGFNHGYLDEYAISRRLKHVCRNYATNACVETCGCCNKHCFCGTHSKQLELYKDFILTYNSEQMQPPWKPYSEILATYKERYVNTTKSDGFFISDQVQTNKLTLGWADQNEDGSWSIQTTDKETIKLTNDNVMIQEKMEPIKN